MSSVGLVMTLEVTTVMRMTFVRVKVKVVMAVAALVTAVVGVAVVLGMDLASGDEPVMETGLDWFADEVMVEGWVSVVVAMTLEAVPGVEAAAVLSPDYYTVTENLEADWNLADCNSVDPEMLTNR